ncbi:TPA: hypothetical protein L3743_003956 [Pseudomonas aeruginosa]|nr:hypothetical protein PkP19E3_32055 [Pseudomonas koreensis]EKW4790855.1 hypothetical protein [Pseudomonas aeruginosa]ELE1002315.1 hypothetical protein [Pseudomonas aeruginosa]RUJ25135.1 hypothetical protein IPC380_08230 [Pseudomonas aeruginosa]RUJ43174.1 hypothetical protein IPC369_10200 [Pseudomonas aeruginosa]
MVTVHTRRRTFMEFKALGTGRSTFDEHYGAAAYSLGDQLGFIYFRSTGIEPSHWESRIYENGLVAMAPVATDTAIQEAFDKVDLCAAHARAFSRAMEALSAHGCSDEVLCLLTAAEGQIQELISAV